MGGKTSKSTQQITIPPEVLARYRAINARADTVTNRPYQYYGGEFVAPLNATQQSGIANTNAAANMAQPYFGAATNQLMNAQGAATPYYQTATNQLNQGVNTGQQLAGQSYNTLNNAQNVGNQFAGQSSDTINAAQSQGAGIQQNALNNLGAAYSSAQPYNQAAGGLYQQGLGQGSNITGQALSGTQQALIGAQPYQGMATDYMNSGAQAVNPYDLGADQINKYMSPYLNTVLQGTAGILNQQNQQQQAGQMGNAIRSGAFGGDRSGIAAANLNQQQNLANAQIYSGILNQGYGQALGTAQQQQQLGLSAAQANRAAQQQASTQALAIGQQGFGQGLSAAQQQGALGQQLFNMNSTTGQNTAALGQQVYGQGTNTAQQQSNVGNTLFNQGATTAAQQAALGQQQFAQGATTAAQQAALGQQQFAQGNTAAGTSAALGQGLYGMGANTSEQLAALGTGAQNTALTGAAAQMAAGQTEQATQQALDTAKYNEFLQAQSLPYQQLKLAGDIALGTGTASGSTTTTSQPGGFFSDERLKENIKAVGKTFDGQTIHSYNYKGDPRTQIGLIAQEVQKHHPEAVGLAGGYKTVNYDKATEDAADRGHMASGGLASAGGSVMPYNAGQGFAGGGVAGFDPAIMQQILAAQQAMYAPLSEGGMYAGGPNAGGGLVPQTELTAHQLMVPAELARQATGAEQAKTMVDLGNSVNKFGEGIGAWGGDKKPADKGFEISKGTSKDISALSEAEKAQKDQDEYLFKALGGGIPYSGQGLDIPDSGLAAGSGSPMTAGALPGQQSGLDKLNKVANIADTGMKLGKFGKKIGLFSTGGTPYGGHGLDIPEEDSLDKTYQLPTAGEMPGKPESGVDKIGKIAKIAGTVASLFSDERMKENIKPVGKLFDGQIVHSFNYKGDPRTQIGLIAQEVEDHKPHAVGLAGKYKTVDYDKATSAAAHRGHFAMGGEPEGGGLMGAEMAGPDQNEQGFDFNLDPEDLIAGSDSQFESLLRSKPEAAPQQANGLAASGEEFRKEMEARKNAPHGMGLAAATKAPPRIIPNVNRGSGPRSVRNNNPGNIEDGSLAKSMPGYAGSDGRFAIFNAPQAGRAAQMALIRSYINRGYDTPWEIAHRWAPPKEKGNNPVAYANSIAKMAGVGVHDRVPMSAIPLVANAQTMVEGGQRALSHFTQRGNADHFAAGGLAGRDGYQTAGTVVPSASQQEQIDFEEKKRIAEEEKAAAEAPAKGVAAAGPSATTTVTVPPASTNPDATGVAPPEDIVVNAQTAKADPRGEPQPTMRETIYGRGKQQPISLEGGSIAPFNYDYMSEPFFKGIKRGSAGSIIPLLTGIAAMGTAPTRSLGVALATGLGAGAQSYQNLSNERNKQLPIRQAAAAKQAEVAKMLADRFFRLSDDGKNFLYTPPGGETILLTPGERMAMLQEMTTGNMQFFPRTPKNAPLFAQDNAAPKTLKFKSTVAPGNDSVEAIIAGANANPTVAEAFNARAQAEAEMEKQKRLAGSPFAAPEDVVLAGQRLENATRTFTANDKIYNDALSAIADSKLASFGTSVNNIGTANLETYSRAQDRLLELQPLIPVVKEYQKIIASGGLTGGTTTTFWNRLASAALALGASPEVVGNGQTAAQKQAALAALLPGNMSAALSVENTPAAIQAVVGALDSTISTAQQQSDRASQSMRPTATPKINRAITPEAAPAAAAPAAAPAASAPSASGIRKHPNSTPQNPMVIAPSYEAAVSDRSIPNGTMVYYRDANGNMAKRPLKR